MLSKSKWTPLLALLALLPLAACGPDEAGEMETDPMEEPAAEPMADEPAMSDPMSIMLEPKNESGVTGEATATHDQDSVTVEVNISGASGDGAYPAHVHSGDCASTGPVLAPLTPLEILGGGGSSTTTLAASQVPQDQGAVVQVHDSSGQPVACGDLMGHGAMGMEGGAMDEGAMEDTTGTEGGGAG